MTTSQTKLDTFTQAYIECALWSSTDNADESGGEPLDRNYSVQDVHPDTLAQMVADCDAFQEDNQTTLDLAELSPERAGQDFWLNRNGHGSGFWDEYFGPDAERRHACNRLSEASHAYGSFDLYIGDDGMIHGS
jgi:hypothetical protein